MGHPTRACLAAIAAAAVLGGTAAAAVAPAPAKPAAPGKGPPAATAATAPAVPTVSVGFYVIRRTEEAWTVMDPAAVERVAGGPVRRTYSVTIRRNLLNGGPPQPGYVRTLSEYDCDARRFRWRTFTIYNRFGAVVVKQDNADPTFGLPDPGTEEDTSLRVVCEGAGGGSVVAANSLGQLVIGLMSAWDEAAMAASLQQIAPPPKPAARPAQKPARPLRRDR
jgi:hypothetical protein